MNNKSIDSAEVFKLLMEYLLLELSFFGSGIKMWILNQGAAIEVLEPVELREEIIKAIKNMIANYK